MQKKRAATSGEKLIFIFRWQAHKEKKKVSFVNISLLGPMLFQRHFFFLPRFFFSNLINFSKNGKATHRLSANFFLRNKNNLVGGRAAKKAATRGFFVV